MFDDIKTDNNDSSKEAPQEGAQPSAGPLTGTRGSQEESKEENMTAGDTGITTPAPPSQSAPARTPQESAGDTEDIFAQVDGAPGEKEEKPPVFQPKAPDASGPIAPVSSTAPIESNFKKIIALVILVLGLGAIGYGSYWAISKYILTPEEDIKAPIQPAETVGQPTTAEPEPTPPVKTEPEPTPEPVKEEPVTTPLIPLDTDKDGLTDQEERGLGTDIKSVDSDDDGLFDREEVKTYKTDPLNSDSDGDGFLDGEEVRGGYNPLGPGKLYEVGESN